MTYRKNILLLLAFFCMRSHAQTGITVREFSALAASSEAAELTVKIDDVLNKENQDMINDACHDANASVTLDLSDCSFEDDERNIDFYHIQNVRKCVLPLRTKSVSHFDCDALEEIALPDGLEEIRHSAFFDSEKLQYVRIPKSVKHVGACAFGDCDSLRYIQLDKDTDTTKWSPAWNHAEIIYDQNPSETRAAAENENKIRFDHEVYHLFSKINFKITLAKPPAKSQEATLRFCDEHNLNTDLGEMPIKLKKNKTEYEFDDVSTAEMGLEDTDLIRAIMDECADYWVKLKCSLEFSDGTETDLEGSARLYVVF